MVLGVLAYYAVAYSNPGFLRVKDKSKFTHTMEYIETQFRNGNISVWYVFRNSHDTSHTFWNETLLI